MSQRRSRFLAAAGLTAASLVVGAILIEIGLRLVGVSDPFLFDVDPIRGNALHPGAAGWVRGEAGYVYVSINSDGLHDREHAVAKPPGTLRIAVLGDSFAEAFQVPPEDNFSSVLERELGSCPAAAGRAVEVINFGISGHGTAQELLTYRHFARKYRPDIVLVALYTGNDMRNNSRALEQSPYRPYFVLEGGKLVLDDSFRKLPDFAPGRIAWIRTRLDIFNATYIGQLVAHALSQLFQPAPEEAPADVLAGGEAGIHDAAFMPPANDDWTAAWRVTEAVLRTLNEEARADGARLWIATLTSGIQVHRDAALRKAYMDRLGVKSLDYPDRRIAAFGARERIPVITLLNPFRAHVEANRVLLHGFDGRGTGHWNAEGHRLGGEIMAGRICASLR